MASEMKKDTKKKPNWPLIVIIAFCACAIIAAAALVIVQFSKGRGDEDVTDPNATETVEPGPDGGEQDEAEPEPPEDNYPVTAPAGALNALDKLDAQAGSPYNVLLMGVDAGGSLTDVIMIYQIDPANERVNVLSVPRDTKVTYNGRAEKINAVHSYGRQRKDPEGGDRSDEFAINIVRDLTGIPIHHYMCINTAAFRGIIDALDGFDYEVTRNMDYDDRYQNLHIHLTKGRQHIDGDSAEQLVRFRRYPNGDIDRVKIQQSVLRTLAEQKINSEYIEKIPEIFKLIDGNISTDLTPVSTAKLAADVLLAMEDDEDENAEADGGASENSADADRPSENEALTGRTGGLSTYILPGSFGSGGVSYWLPNRSAINTLVRDVFGYGE